MGKLIFGNDESIECIHAVKLKGTKGEPLCIAHKTTTTFFGAGVWMKDDGYVLSASKSWYYPVPKGEELKELQASGLMPDPLPDYSIPAWKYGVGYSLWIVIAIIIAFSAWTSARKKRRLRQDAEAPLSVGPVALDSPADRFVNDAVRPMLKANEQIDQQAFGFTEPMLLDGALVPGEKAAHAVLTNQRLVFLHLQKLEPTADVVDVEELARARIAAVASDDGLMHIYLDDGSVKLLWVRRREGGLSNQLRFIRDLPKLFPMPQAHPEAANVQPRVETNTA